MATYTSDSLDSVKITAGDGDAYKTRYLTFSWWVTSTSIGKTTIKWEIHGKGGNTAYSTFSVKLDGEEVYSANNEVISYKSSEPLKSDTKTYQHDNNGAAKVSVEITVKKIWSTISSNTQTSDSWSLETNYPYTNCGEPSSVTITPAVVKPDGKFTVKWNASSDGNGGNTVAGYKIWYQIGAQSWSDEYSTNSTSIELTLSDTAKNFRGESIRACVQAIGKISGYNSTYGYSDPKKTRVNNLPSEPTNLAPNKTIIPSTASVVQFTMTTGSDEDKQTCSIKYSTSETGAKYDYDIGGDLPFDITKNQITYYFWTWDGLEPSEDYVSCEIKRNTAPTVSIKVDNLNYNQTIEATSGTDGQNNNTYTYGYQYNGTDYPFTTTTQSTYKFGDIRYYLSQRLGGLAQKTTYRIKYWVQRNDGIENSNKSYSPESSFTTPQLTINAIGEGQAGYFGRFVHVTSSTTEHYHPLGNTDFNTILRGSQLTKIELKREESSSQKFNIKLNSDQYLTRVYEFKFTNLQTKETIFKPYSQPALEFSMAGYSTDYGFSGNPKLTIKDYGDPDKVYGNADFIKIGDTWNFGLTPDLLWGDSGIASSVVNDNQATKKVWLVMQNDFGEDFSTPLTLNFDFKEAPEIENFKVCRKDGDKDPPSLVKENTPVSIEGSITYYGKKLKVVINEPKSGFEFYNYEKTESTYKKDPWIKNNSGGWDPNPHGFDLWSELSDPDILVPAQEKTYKTNFQINATSTNTTGSADSQEVTIQRHVPVKIHFTRLEYSNPTLSGSFKIDDFGYDENTGGYVSGVFLDGNKIYDGNITSNDEIVFEIKDYKFGDSNYLLLAPICETIFDLEGATTTKTTTALEYMVVYNILPTIAYRQNCLGINTKDPTNNEDLERPALTINAYNEENDDGHKYIYLTSARNTASINLVTGEQNGFIYHIDCGSW